MRKRPLSELAKEHSYLISPITVCGISLPAMPLKLESISRSLPGGLVIKTASAGCQTYGHLRDAHSFEMAKRMTFSAQDQQPSNVVALTNAQSA